MGQGLWEGCERGGQAPTELHPITYMPPTLAQEQMKMHRKTRAARSETGTGTDDDDVVAAAAAAGLPSDTAETAGTAGTAVHNTAATAAADAAAAAAAALSSARRVDRYRAATFRLRPRPPAIATMNAAAKKLGVSSSCVA